MYQQANIGQLSCRSSILAATEYSGTKYNFFFNLLVFSRNAGFAMGCHRDKPVVSTTLWNCYAFRITIAHLSHSNTEYGISARLFSPIRVAVFEYLLHHFLGMASLKHVPSTRYKSSKLNVHLLLELPACVVSTWARNLIICEMFYPFLMCSVRHFNILPRIISAHFELALAHFWFTWHLAINHCWMKFDIHGSSCETVQ